jgi:hypothetical protein
MPSRFKFFTAGNLILIVLISFFWITVSHATVLVLPYGDKLTGKVVDIKSGKLYFYSEALKATVIIDSDKAQLIETTIQSNPAKTPPNTTVEHNTVLTVKSPSKAPKDLWKGKLELGYSQATAAGVHSVDLSVAAEETKTHGLDEYLARGRILYSALAQIPTANQEDASFRWRHSLTPLLFGQSETSYNKDKIQLINYQYQQTAGIGFKLNEDPRKVANLVLGITGEALSVTGFQNGYSYLGKVSEDFIYKFNNHIQFTEDASLEYSPLLQNHNGLVQSLSEQINTTIAEYNYKVRSTIASKLTPTLTFNVNFEYNYNNAILDPLARTEEKFISALSYGF